jgi:hypothetical protein
VDIFETDSGRRQIIFVAAEVAIEDFSDLFGTDMDCSPPYPDRIGPTPFDILEGFIMTVADLFCRICGAPGRYPARLRRFEQFESGKLPGSF